jgi:hypothetical protein
MRISGIGTTLLGVSSMDAESIATATEWFTFIYLPIIPLNRYRVRFLPHKGSGYSYEILDREPVNAREVLKTYLLGWVLTPVVLFGTLMLGLEEVFSSIGLPESWQMPIIIFGIVWVIVAVWIMLDKHEAKYHPTEETGGN